MPILRAKKVGRGEGANWPGFPPRLSPPAPPPGFTQLALPNWPQLAAETRSNPLMARAPEFLEIRAMGQRPIV